jgi:anti-sigma factor RsiW
MISNETRHVRVLLGAFLLGGLAAHEESAVRAHLEICAECRAEHDYLACVPQWLDLMREATAAAAEPGGARHLYLVEPPATS